MRIFAEPAAKPRLKVKLTTTAYRTKSGLVQQKQLYFYKKPAPLMLIDCIFVDFSNSDNRLDYVITNFDETQDGVYELVIHNESYDYESGCLDDWSWKLIEWRD